MREERPKRTEEETSRRRRNKYDNPETDYDESTLEMGDKYDVIKQIITVNSPISTMNPDFILGDLHPQILENPVMKYVRDQLNIIEAVNIYLNKPDDKQGQTWINQLMLNGVYSLENLSRADKAAVRNAILRYIETGEGGGMPPTPIEEETNEQKEGTLSKLNPLNWLKKKENK